MKKEPAVRHACFGSLFLVLLAVGLAPSRLGAQEDPHAACTAAGWVPRSILARPVSLRAGVGNNGERVTTTSAEAQSFYDQGLNYLHGYVWIEAARSFQQALRHDPDLAMAYVGLSRVYSGLDDAEGARAALEKAEERAHRAMPRERRRIALRRDQLEAMDALADAARHAAYKKKIDEALAEDPGDVELWLVRGNAEEPTAAGRGQRGTAASTPIYDRVLAIAPDNAAAHHYLTHSYETIGRIPKALEHGEAYARLAPSIPHAHHMWGHDLRRVGRIDDAIAAFRKTYELEKAYYAAEDIDRGFDWHHVHNLDLLATSYQHKGQMRQAEALLREADSLPAVSEYVEYNQKASGFFYLSRGRWPEAVGAAERMQRARWASTRTVAHVIAGHAQLALGRETEARASLAAAERELLEVPVLAAGLNRMRGQVDPDVETLRAELLVRAGKPEGGERMRKAAAALRAVPGPDAWILALFRIEAMARIAREAEDWKLADDLARELLDHDPAYAGSQMAVALVAGHRGDRAAADRALAAAAEYWRDADTDLPEWALLRPQRASAP
jgi:tetratricopeptide (TPR) repeat protein